MPQILWVTFWVLCHVWSPIGRYRRTMKICQEFTPGKHDKHDDVNMQAFPRTTLDVSLRYKPRDLVFERLNRRHYGVATKSPILNVTRCCKPSDDYLPGEFWNHPSHLQEKEANSSFQFLLQKKDIKHPDTPSPLSFLSQAIAITLSECSLCFLLWNRTTQLTSICFLPDCTKF